MMRCSSGLCSYWHTRASSSGAPASPGNRYPRYSRAARSPSPVACRSPAVGSNGGPRVSSATLKPRHRLPGIPYMKRAPWSAQTGRASSVNRVSPGGVPKKKTSWRVGRTRSPITSGEQATEPGARGEHVRVGAQHAPVRERDAAHRSRRHVPRSHGELAILAPLLEEPREHGLAREPGGQVAGVTLENRPAHFLAVDLGIPPRGLGAAQLLERESGLLEDRQRRPFVLIIVLHEPQHADRVVEPALPAPLLLAPQRERARGEDRVETPRPVGPPDHAR